jgi:hypothetical protein
MSSSHDDGIIFRYILIDDVAKKKAYLEMVNIETHKTGNHFYWAFVYPGSSICE